MYYTVDFKVYSLNGEIKDEGQGAVATCPSESFEKNCNGLLLKDFVAYDPLIAKAVEKMGIKDCAYLGWESPLGFVLPVKPVKSFPKSVTSYIQIVSSLYLSYGIDTDDMGGCDCYIKGDASGESVLARFATVDGVCVDFKKVGNAFVVSDGDDDLSAVGVKCINQAKNLLP